MTDLDCQEELFATFSLNGEEWQKIYSQPTRFPLKITKERCPRYRRYASSNLGSAEGIIDLRDKMPPIWNQGDLGSCTSFASLACQQFNLLTWEGSKLFQYYNTRLLEGTVGYDAGATMSTAVRALVRYGVCKESSWPYVPSNFKTPPPSSCYVEAETHQALTYDHVRFSDLISCLQQGYPIMFGFMVFESFLQIGSDGIMPMPSSSEDLLGGHAVVMVGYDGQRKMFIVRNSWGSSWGSSGHFYMPYDYVANPTLCTDFWRITSVEIPETVTPPRPVPIPGRRVRPVPKVTPKPSNRPPRKVIASKADRQRAI